MSLGVQVVDYLTGVPSWNTFCSPSLWGSSSCKYLSLLFLLGKPKKEKKKNEKDNVETKGPARSLS